MQKKLLSNGSKIISFSYRVDILYTIVCKTNSTTYQSILFLWLFPASYSAPVSLHEYIVFLFYTYG